MWKRVLLIIGAIIMAGGLAIIVINSTVSADGIKPPNIIAPVAHEPESIDPGGFQEVFLEPIRPGDEGWNAWNEQPDPFSDQGEAVNGFIKGTSDRAEYRCVVYLEPIKPGETSSKASDPVCTAGPIESINGISLDSSYLVAKFYNWTNYLYRLVEYYGGSPCSPSISYGVTDLPDNLDNKFASGQAFSDCDHISVYDFNNYTGPSYYCGANCSSFYALNDDVSSWTVGD